MRCLPANLFVSGRRHMAIIWQTQQPRYLCPPALSSNLILEQNISLKKRSPLAQRCHCERGIFHHPLESWLKRGGYAEDTANIPPILCRVQYQTTPAVSRAADTIFAIAHTFSSSYFLATSCTSIGAPSGSSMLSN